MNPRFLQLWLNFLKTDDVDAVKAHRRGVNQMQRLRLEPLSPDEIAQWDKIVASFPQRTVFHRRAWLDCLAESHQIEWRFWSVMQSSRVVGYFCGGIIQRGPFRMLGSPLRSWHTTILVRCSAKKCAGKISPPHPMTWRMKNV